MTQNITETADALSKITNVFPELPGVKIITELARSPKGITYKATRLLEGDIVAIKHFRRALCEKKIIEQLPRSAEAAFFLEHSNLVHCLGCANENNRLLLISEFAPGEALSRILRQKLPLSTSRALSIILRCANGLQYAANKKQNHGRLHPSDILVSEESARILGVGLGERPEHPAWETRDPQLFEPLIYTAPEALPSQSFPTTEIGLQAVDIYALGAILFHLLTGAPPFRGTDEDALIAERQGLRGAVEWPSMLSLPLETRNMIEKMMAIEPRQRPSFETVILALTDALNAAKKTDQLGFNAQTIKQSTTAASAPQGIRQASTPIMTPITSMPSNFSNSVNRIKKRYKRVSSLYATIALAVLTAIVFTFAMAKTYLYTPPLVTMTNTSPTTSESLDESKEVGIAPTQKTAIETALTPKLSQPEQITALTISPSANEKLLIAVKQLALIEEMLKKGEIQYSLALLRIVKRIADTLEKDALNGLKAALLMADIEDTLQKKNSPAPMPQTTPVAIARTIAPSTPSPASLSPSVANTPPQLVIVKNEEQEKEALAKDKARASAMIKTAMSRAAQFQYTDAIAELNRAAPSANTQIKRLVQDSIEMIKQEQAFFLLCRQRLLNEIERHPRKESPLQIRPRKNDPGGAGDILDFDENGLKVSFHRGAVADTRIYKWEKVPVAQAFNLFQNLANKNNVGEQLGVAVFCFNRGLSVDSEVALEIARNLPNSKERSESIADICKNITELTTTK